MAEDGAPSGKKPLLFILNIRYSNLDVFPGPLVPQLCCRPEGNPVWLPSPYFQPAQGKHTCPSLEIQEN